MRPLVEPPPTLRCMCGGELRLKLIEPTDRSFGKQREIFVCTNCSREQTRLADRNPYVASTASHPEDIQRHRTKLGVGISTDDRKRVRNTAHKPNASVALVAAPDERDQDAAQDAVQERQDRHTA
jgi:hypothetical protein